MDDTILFWVLFAAVVNHVSFGIPVGFRDHPARASRSASTCRTPGNLHSLLLSINNITDGGTFLRSVNWTDASLLGGGEFSDEEVMERLDLFTENNLCSATHASPDAPLCVRSLCPWKYGILHLQTSYYPSRMLKAICEHSCLENPLNVCEPVTTNVQVLKEDDDVCIGGFKVYKVETIPLPVGCTCAKPRTSQPVDVVSGYEDCPPPFGCARKRR